MRKSLLLLIFLFVTGFANAQTIAMPFSGTDCNGNSVDLYADLDSGKAVVLFFYMPSCGTCPPPARRIQEMANRINASHPGMVKGYAFPYQNSTTCGYSSNWVTSNQLSALYAPMDSGAAHVAHYGGFGMPTVVLLGTNREVLFSTLSFSTSDTTIMRDAILGMLPAATPEMHGFVSAFSVYPNPASGDFYVNAELKEAAELKIEVRDITGKTVALVANEKHGAGLFKKHILTAAMLPAGYYFVQLQVNGKTSTQKLAIIR